MEGQFLVNTLLLVSRPVFVPYPPFFRTFSHKLRENVVLFTLMEISRLYLDLSSNSTSLGFADAVTWRNSFLASPDLLSFWIPVTVSPGLDDITGPYGPLHTTI